MNDRDINQNEPENEEDTNPSDEDMRNMMDMWHGTIDQHEEEERLREKVTQLEEKITQLEGELSRREKKSDTKKQPGEIQHENTSGVFSSMFQAIAAMSKTTRIAILCAGIFAAVLAVSGVFSLAGSVSGLFRRPAPTANISTVITAVEACGEMITYRAYFESIADYLDKGWILDKKFAVIFGGTVDCGFDMRMAKAEIFEKERRIEITLPHCRVLKPNIDIKSIRVYDEKGSVSLKDQNKILAKSTEEIEQRAAKEWNVLVRAEDNAVKLYKDFLKSFNYDVKVVFTDDKSKLSVPSGSNADTMKGGGVLIVHNIPEKKTQEAE